MDVEAGVATIMDEGTGLRDAAGLKEWGKKLAQLKTARQSAQLVAILGLHSGPSSPACFVITSANAMLRESNVAFGAKWVPAAFAVNVIALRCFALQPWPSTLAHCWAAPTRVACARRDARFG